MKIFSKIYQIYQRNIEVKKIQLILKNWNLKNSKIKKISAGKPNANWLVKTHSQIYVLQKIGLKEWVEYIECMILLVNELSQSDFPYSIPNLISTIQGEVYVTYGNNYWWLSEFIEGNQSNSDMIFFSNKIQPYQLGVLVAEFYKAVCNINLNNFKKITPISLFNTDAIKSDIVFLEDKIRALKVNKENLLLSQIYDLWTFYRLIKSEKIERVQNMNQVLIHYDFHGGNVLNINDQLTSLIDFDSLSIAPRIIDIQIALFYIASNNEGLDIQKIESFMKGYCSVSSCLSDELSLISIVMFERLFVILLGLLRNRDINSFPLQENDFEMRFIHVLNWLMLNKNNMDMKMMMFAKNNDSLVI